MALGLALLAFAAGARAGDDFKPEEGFTSLFNGKDLTGWRYKGSKEDLAGKAETADARVAVENGVIVMREKDSKGKGGIRELATVKDWPKGFHLRLEFRAGLKADSGVYVRGTQLQVRDYKRRNERKQLTAFKNDDWNTLDIVVKNEQVTTSVNNEVLSDRDTLSFTYKGGKATATLNGKEVPPRSVQVRIGPTATCLCNGEPLEVMTNIPKTGAIGLQAESGKFEFRRVRVKELE
jgi:hypothetical protein